MFSRTGQAFSLVIVKLSGSLGRSREIKRLNDRVKRIDLVNAALEVSKLISQSLVLGFELGNPSIFLLVGGKALSGLFLLFLLILLLSTARQIASAGPLQLQTELALGLSECTSLFEFGRRDRDLLQAAVEIDVEAVEGVAVAD